MKAINFKPINEYVVVALPEVEEKTESGIIKTAETIKAEKENSSENDYVTVVALSNEVTKVKLGDDILVSANRLNMIRIDGKTYGLIPESGILGFKENF